MANVRDGDDDSPVPAENAPSDGDSVRRENDHDKDHNGGEHERDPKPLEYLRDLLPEVGPLDFLLRRAPGDVVREQVREQCLRQMNAQATEEEEAVSAGASGSVSPRNGGRGLTRMESRSGSR